MAFIGLSSINIIGNRYGDWEFTWGTGNVAGMFPHEYFPQQFAIKFKPKRGENDCGCGKIGFVQTLQPLKLSNRRIDESNTRRKLDRATKDGTFLDRPDGYFLPWYGSNNDGTPRTGQQFGKRLRPDLIDALMDDTPGPYYSEVVWKFETCAVCIEGDEKNFVYGCLQGIAFTLTGGRNDGNFVTGIHVDGTTTVSTANPTHSDQPSREFMDAVKKWNEQDGNTAFDLLLSNPCEDSLSSN